MYNIKKLIELVKENRILYDLSHPDYKNIAQKEKIWKEIGAALDQDFHTVKKKWKNMKDSYAKHLKSKTLMTPSARRYTRWPWASQMEQFKPFLPFTSGLTPIANAIPKISVEDCETNSTSSADFVKTAFKNQEETFTSPNSFTSIKRKRSLNMKTTSTPSSTVNKILDHLKNNRTHHDYDATELIFLGYAKTIKKFSLERQANIKLEVAQIIMRHEIDNEKDEIMSSIASSNSPEFINPKVEML